MELPEIQRFLHELNNDLNAVNLNIILLKQLHAESLDKETLIRIEAALASAIKRTSHYQDRVRQEAAKKAPSDRKM